jgi:hypothetical protein
LTFTLDQDWQSLNERLGLANEQQTYMIWLWLD